MHEEQIPLLDLAPEIEELGAEITAAIQRVLHSKQFILGPEVLAFEDEVASYLGVRHAIGVNSGTDALVIGLRTLGIGPGDEVITSPFTFFATAEAISSVGARPVFVDVDPVTFNLAAEQIEAKISSATRAIMPVHLFGQAADMGLISEIAERHGLMVLEDCAQAFGGDYRGKKLGTLGQIGAFSFFPTKNLGCYGDGGLITTDDEQSATTARALRAHGSQKKYFNETIGYNSRLDAIQAAILRIKLKKIESSNEGRRRVAAGYRNALGDLQSLCLPAEHPDGRHVYHQFTLRVLSGKRQQLQKALSENNIASMVYYPVPVHRLPVYDEPAGTCPVAERLADEVISLPIWPQMETAKLQKISEIIRAAI